MTVRACCEVMTERLKRPGCKGFSVLVRRFGDGLRFVTQARPVEVSEAEKFESAVVSSYPDSVATVIQTGVRYCPACGFELASLVAKEPTVYEQLSVDHEEYVLGD